MPELFIFILLTVCGTLTGFYFSKRLSDRYSMLLSFQSALRQTYTYIRYNRLQLSEVFYKLYCDFKLPLSQRLLELSQNGMPFYDEWSNCINGIECLHREDKSVLSMLGDELGRSDTDGQLSALLSAQDILRDRISQADTDKNKKGRLYRTIGVLLGAAAGIMFI